MKRCTHCFETSLFQFPISIVCNMDSKVDDSCCSPVGRRKSSISSICSSGTRFFTKIGKNAVRSKQGIQNIRKHISTEERLPSRKRSTEQMCEIVYQNRLPNRRSPEKSSTDKNRLPKFPVKRKRQSVFRLTSLDLGFNFHFLNGEAPYGFPLILY